MSWLASSSVISMKSFCRSPRSAETREALCSHTRFRGECFIAHTTGSEVCSTKHPAGVHGYLGRSPHVVSDFI